MTGLDLSDRQQSADDGIGGRFVIGWKTIAGLLIAAFLAFSALERRQSVAESDIQNLKSQNLQVQQQLQEIRMDVKELLRRRP